MGEQDYATRLKLSDLHRTRPILPSTRPSVSQTNADFDDDAPSLWFAALCVLMITTFVLACAAGYITAW
jgi:hypothetical protein